MKDFIKLTEALSDPNRIKIIKRQWILSARRITRTDYICILDIHID